VEDEQVLGPHPKDPYKRVECFPTSREVRVEIDGKVCFFGYCQALQHLSRFRKKSL
jgi:hypothetical protein